MESGLSVQQALAAIQKAIPAHELFGIYLGGSYVRNEQTMHGNINLYVVLRTVNYLEQLAALRDQYEREPVHGHKIHIGYYTLDECSSGSFDPTLGQLNRRWEPKFFLRDAQTFKTLLGEPLDLSLFQNLMTDDQEAEATIVIIRGWLAKQWEGDESKRIRAIAKQVNRLALHEMRLKYNEEFHPERARAVRFFQHEQDHVVHLCDAIIKDPANDLVKKEAFLSKVHHYLDDFELLLRNKMETV